MVPVYYIIKCHIPDNHSPWDSNCSNASSSLCNVQVHHFKWGESNTNVTQRLLEASRWCVGIAPYILKPRVWQSCDMSFTLWSHNLTQKKRPSALVSKRPGKPWSWVKRKFSTIQLLFRRSYSVPNIHVTHIRHMQVL
jgi:hypothetical protein